MEALNGQRKPLLKRLARAGARGHLQARRGGTSARAPALEILEALLHKGADVRYADPFVPSVAVGETTLVAVPADAEVFRWADAALVLTDHREFDYQALTRQVPLIVDARNATRGIPDAAGRVIRL